MWNSIDGVVSVANHRVEKIMSSASELFLKANVPSERFPRLSVKLSQPLSLLETYLNLEQDFVSTRWPRGVTGMMSFLSPLLYWRN